MKKTVLIALALAGVALAATQSLTLVLNGKISSKKAITVNGETYVPLSSLTALGIKVSSASGTVSLTSGSSVATPAGNSGSSGSGGANQKSSVEGCLGENLFNGIWRLRVAKIEPFVDGSQNGYDVTVEIRNGVSKTIAGTKTGITPSASGKNLILSDGQALEFANSSASAWIDAAFKSIPQGSLNKVSFRYYLPEGVTEKPAKFLFEVDAAELDKDLKVGFTVKDPSFRVDLTCKK